MKGDDSGIENQVNFAVLFMNKLKSAVEHRTDKANALFEGELYGVPPCFSVNCTDQMYQGENSTFYLEKAPIMPTTLKRWSFLEL